ncbi:hypothetical protein [Lentzea flava]|nr:hypothetical protein [Lentzea flava]
MKPSTTANASSAVRSIQVPAGLERAGEGEQRQQVAVLRNA